MRAIPISRFYFAKDTNELLAEASDLGPARVDDTLTIQGERETVEYRFDSVKRDREGEIQTWTYLPTSGNHPRVTIFND